MAMDSGILFLCELNDIAEPGDMPKEGLTKIARHWYEERTIGMQRQYLAKGVNEQIDLLARIHFEPQAKIGLYAMLGNGEQFRITNIANGKGVDGLRYTDLTLTRLEDNFDVADTSQSNP